MNDLIESDILVVGSGISGLLFTLHLTQNTNYTVSLVTKRSLTDTNTDWAQGGIASVLSPKDTFESHIEDTLTAGDGLCKPTVVKEVIENGPDQVRLLESLGVPFDKVNGEFELGKEGGHHERRVAHVKDFTGHAIQSTLTKRIRETKNVQIFENHMMIDLVTVSDKIAGAYVFDKEKKKVLRFQSKLTVLATGGAGKVFLYTSNPDTASGDGIAIAYRAGAIIRNMEFFQFHPTCLYHPYAKSFLISEALRGEGAILKTMDGDHFTPRYHDLADLAPRDIVARAIDSEMKKRGDDHVYLDISFKQKEFIQGHFPHIDSTLKEYGIDMTSEPIPVVPAAHYTMGGIASELNGKTNIAGLLAIGETTNTGLHGANRLASNSLLEGAVMAKNAFSYTKELLDKGIPEYTFSSWDEGTSVESDEAVFVTHAWDEIRRAMWNYVGIVRTDGRLLKAKKRLKLIKDEVQQYYWDYKVSSNLIELRNLIDVANLIIESALLRKESRGAHYRLDYPMHSPDVRDTLAHKILGVFLSEDIHIDEFSPKI